MRRVQSLLLRAEKGLQDAQAAVAAPRYGGASAQDLARLNFWVMEVDRLEEELLSALDFSDDQDGADA